MRFWDASALVPLCVTMPRTAVTRKLLERDRDIALWWGTPVECASAFARQRREARASAEAEAQANDAADRLLLGGFVIPAGSQVLERALRLVRTHPLRAADAVQLAAAIVWANDAPIGRELVTLDHRLREAALREGFTVLPGEA